MLDDPDKALLDRFRSGDSGAFRVLVTRYQRPIYNAAFRVLGNGADASDVAQTVFLRVAERLDDYDPKFKFFSWIYRIAVNEAIDMLRRNQHEEPLDDEIDFAGPDHANPETQYGTAQLADRVQRALMTMKTEDRIVLTLRHFSELSYRQIAEVLGIEEKTVKSRVYDARQRLGLQLGEFKASLS